MILIDTNVLSEVMRPEPNARVLRWYRSTQRYHLYTTTVTVAETFAGILALPAGHRRAGMEADARAMFAIEFEGRVLAFDMPAAESYARIASGRKASGRPIKPLDGQIAAIARIHDMAVATRNTSDFEDCGIDLVNPWEA
jgi:predicted nucleic acid-binding protein